MQQLSVNWPHIQVYDSVMTLINHDRIARFLSKNALNEPFLEDRPQMHVCISLQRNYLESESDIIMLTLQIVIYSTESDLRQPDTKEMFMAVFGKSDVKISLQSYRTCMFIFICNLCHPKIADWLFVHDVNIVRLFSFL